ncbi:outer membrane beta-barrel protein [Catenovulum sp. SX2]|uniref:outer membrane beta-barrel protein n=1 Tax=Catenovulum sp. SX2 TaxID=3398614 RepID=UPI003F855C30
MQKLTQQCLFATSLLALSSVAQAEDAGSQDSYQHQQSVMYFSVGSIGIDKTVAFFEGIGDSATSIRFGYEDQTGNFVWGVGVSGLLYDDEEKFSQQVENSWSGKQSSESSDADAFGVYGEIGYRHAFNETISATFMGGYDFTITSERGISNCSNCYSEDIDVSAGLYVAPRLDIQFNESFLMQLSYQNYLSGDLSSGLMVTFGYSYY